MSLRVRVALVPFTLALAALSGACSATLQSEHAPTTRGAPGGVLAQAHDPQQAPARERSLIRTAQLRVEVDDVPAARAQVGQIVSALGGEVANDSSQQDGPARMTLRIPSASLDGALEQLAALGDVTHQSVNATDVTEQLADLDARLANLRALRDRLRKLLDRADKISDVLEIEHELTRTQTEVDRLEGALQRMRGQVALSEVSLALTHKPIPGPLGLVYLGLREVVTRLFWIRE